MIQVSLDSLSEALEDSVIDLKQNIERCQLQGILEVDRGRYPFFLRIVHDANFVQLLVFFPVKLKQERISEIARLLHGFNRFIDLPGFCLDEEEKVAFYRLMVPTTGQQLDEELLEEYIRVVRAACQNFHKLIHAVNSALFPVDTILQELKKGGQGGQRG